MKTLLGYKNKFLVIRSIKRITTNKNYLFHHSNSTFIQILSDMSLEMYSNVMEETPHETLCLSADLKPSSGMAVGMFGLSIARYDCKQTCSQIGQKYRLSFMSMQHKTLGMEIKHFLYFKVVSRSTLKIMWIEKLIEMKNSFFRVISQCYKQRICHTMSKNGGQSLRGGVKS